MLKDGGFQVLAFFTFSLPIGEEVTNDLVLFVFFEVLSRGAGDAFEAGCVKHR